MTQTIDKKKIEQAKIVLEWLHSPITQELLLFLRTHQQKCKQEHIYLAEANLNRGIVERSHAELEAGYKSLIYQEILNQLPYQILEKEKNHEDLTLDDYEHLAQFHDNLKPEKND